MVKQLTKDEIILLVHKKIQMLDKMLDDLYNQKNIHHEEYNTIFDKVIDLKAYIENTDFYKSNIPDY